MTDYQKWLDRVDNLLQVQRDRCLELISANFTRRELIELKMMVEVLMEKVLEEQEPKTDCDYISRDMALEKMADYVSSGYADSANDFEAYSKIICELPSINPIETKTDVLDKINGEIKEYCEKNCIDGDIVANELSLIIDKYRQEG